MENNQGIQGSQSKDFWNKCRRVPNTSHKPVTTDFWSQSRHAPITPDRPVMTDFRNQSHCAPVTPDKPVTLRTRLPIVGSCGTLGIPAGGFVQGSGASDSSSQHNHVSCPQSLSQPLAHTFSSHNEKTSMHLLSNATNGLKRSASYMNHLAFTAAMGVTGPATSFTGSMAAIGVPLSSTTIRPLNNGVKMSASNNQLVVDGRLPMQREILNCNSHQQKAKAKAEGGFAFTCIPNLNYLPDQNMSHSVTDVVPCPPTPLPVGKNVPTKQFNSPNEIIDLSDDDEAEENLMKKTERLNAPMSRQLRQPSQCPSEGSSSAFRSFPCSSTPLPREKSKFAQQLHLPHQAINLLDDNSDEANVPNITLQSQSPPSEPKELRSSRPALLSLESVPLSSGPAIPSDMVIPPQPQSKEVPIASSEKDNAAVLDIEKSNDLDHNGIDLSKTPKQKTRRKKHRPKVIREGKPSRSTKPKTPKPPMSNIDPTTGKRKYVRKRNIEYSPAECSHVPGEISDLNNKLRNKSVRRCLNFDMETSEPRDALQDQTVTHEYERDPHAGVSCLAGTTCSLSSKSPVQLGQELEVVEDNLNYGAKNHLFCSVNQTSNVQSRLAEIQEDTSHVRSSCRTMPETEKPTRSQPFGRESRTYSLIGLTTSNDDTLANNPEGLQESNKSQLGSMETDSSMKRRKRLHIHNDDSHACPGKIDGVVSAFQYPNSNHKKQKTLQEQAGFAPSSESSLSYVPKLGWRNEQSVLYPNAFLTSADVQRQLFLDLQQASEGAMVSAQTENIIRMITDARNEPLSQTEDSNMASPANGLEPAMSCEGNSRQNSKAQMCTDTQPKGSAKQKIRGNRRKDRARQVNSSTSEKTPEKNTNQEASASHKGALHDFGSCTTEMIPQNDALASENIRVEARYSHSSSGNEYQSCSEEQERNVGNLLFQAELPSGDLIDDIILKLRYLTVKEVGDIPNGDVQNAIVPYDGGGMMVPYQGKKRHPRPKVDLDPETDRVWRLLMGKEFSNGVENTSSDKEKWWEDERNVFNGRVDSFIARMHLVQGDRRFSKWKGSVVDSVVGVFLTQNVSDHISSSAFMALAARFPLKAKDNCSDSSAIKRASPMAQEGCSIDEYSTWKDQILCKQVHDQVPRSSIIENESAHNSESYGSNNGGHENSKLKYFDGIETIQEVSLNSPDSITVRGSADPAKVGERCSMDEVISSHCPVVSSHNSSRNPDMISSAKYHSESSWFASSNSEKWKCTPENSAIRVTYSSIGAFDLNINQADNDPTELLVGTQLPRHFYDLSAVRNAGLRNTDGPSDSGTSYQQSVPYEVIHLDKSEIECMAASQFSEHTTKKDTSRHESASFHENDASASDLYMQMGKSSINLFTTSTEETSNGRQLYHDSTLQTDKTDSSVEIQQARHHYHPVNEFSRQQSSVILDETQEKLLRVPGGAETIFNDYSHISKLASSVPPKTKQAEKKVKGDFNSKKTFDWDSLRKEVENIDTKKERTHDRMDSLDWEAIRCANVREISETIRERGMNNVLAERIKEFLDRLVRDHGSVDLEWLRDVEPDKAKDYLLSIRGLGLKSVECVRLLTLHHLAFPVDTNVGRICVRLGWVPIQPLPESLQLHLLELYPVLETIQKYIWPRLCKLDQRTLYELHYQLITFGKVFCTKSKPNCNACPMRGECRHFASAFASARLALPGPEEKSIVSSTVPVSSDSECAVNSDPLPLLEGSRNANEFCHQDNTNPLIQVPETPEPEHVDTEESAIEDAFYEDVDDIRIIGLNSEEELAQNWQYFMQANNMDIQEAEMSKALVALNPEAASIPMPKLKNVNRLRTEHYVYELPDSHPLLEGFDHREADDPSSYLLAIWTPGETSQSIEPLKESCNHQETGDLCTRTTCFTCNSIREAQTQTVRGTILIPCRTAMRGSFPLNGTYFQVNEMFADHDTSRNPIDVPREWIWNLPRRTVYFGTSVTSIFKGLTTEQIQQCFWRGFVCVRGFDRKTKAPRPLYARLHFTASKATRNKKADPSAARPTK